MRTLLATVCTAATILLAGCSDSGTNLQSTAVGTWRLQTANGVPLPYAYQTTNPKLEVLSDQYSLLVDGTFIESYKLRITDGAAVTVQDYSDSGVFSTSGPSLTLTYDDGFVISATRDGNTVTMTQLGAVMVYNRQ